MNIVIGKPANLHAVDLPLLPVATIDEHYYCHFILIYVQLLPGSLIES